MYFGYGVLAILLLLILFFIIIPLIKVLCAPTFTLDASKNDKHLSRKRFRTLKSVAKNIVKGKNSVPDDARKRLVESFNDRYQLRDELNLVYDKYIKKDINKIIWANSVKVACSTGISKNNTFDAGTTIISNVRMIMQIVIKCGYRPTYAKLGKLMFKVFRNALIAYSIESANVAEWLVNACSKFFKDLPAIEMDKINSAIKILDACTGYEYLKNLVSANENKIDILLDTYINQHLTEDLSIATLCRHFHLAHSEIYSIFKEYFFSTPAEYIKMRRLKTACDLLKQTNLPVHKIAKKCGIPDYNYFSKIFKSVFGMSPREFRKSQT
jgi:YesN/AraC family two-component response regulator